MLTYVIIFCITLSNDDCLYLIFALSLLSNNKLKQIVSFIDNVLSGQMQHDTATSMHMMNKSVAISL